MNLLAALEESPLGIWIRESEWGYPIVLICHTLGMASLAGVMFIFDLRLLLASAATPSRWFKTLFRVALVGFAVNFISGAILFAGAPQRFVANPAFQIKLVALVAAACVTWALARRLTSDDARAALTRSLAGLSILLWVTVIGAGRLMAYLR